MSYDYDFFAVMRDEKKKAAMIGLCRAPPPSLVIIRGGVTDADGKETEYAGNDIQRLSNEQLSAAQDITLSFTHSNGEMPCMVWYKVDYDGHGPQIVMDFGHRFVDKNNTLFLRTMDALCSVLKPQIIIQQGITNDTDGVLALDKGVPNQVRVRNDKEGEWMHDLSKDIEAIVKKHKNTK